MTEIREYLRDVNYHRLAYQHAAQQLNVSVDKEVDEDLLKEAHAAALQELEEAGEMLAWYKAAKKRERTPSDDRLATFLHDTVVPCTQIVALASVTHGVTQLEAAPADLERAVDHLHDLAALRQLSYRAVYNLACFEAGKRRRANANPQETTDAGLILRGYVLKANAKDPHDRAFGYLRQALTMTRGSRRAKLVDWAEKDPSLAPLRESPHEDRWKLLIDTFRVLTSTPEPKKEKPDPFEDD
jgi:hypothetical protein